MDQEQSRLIAEDCFQESEQGEDSTVIRRVLLCGNTSRNGYVIPPEAFVDATYASALYESRPVFLDHPKRMRTPDGAQIISTERSVRDAAGIITKVYFEGGKPYGDIETAGYPGGSLLRDLVKLRAIPLGMSHVAEYEWHDAHLPRHKRTKIKRIKQVASVDAVVMPATTNTFYENTREDQMTIEQLTEELTKVRQERDKAQESLNASNARVKELETEVSTLKTDGERLSNESKDLKAKVDKFELEAAIVARRASVEESLKANSLDSSDKAVVTDLWFESLMAESDKAKREALIKDRASFVAEARKTPKSGASEREGRETPQRKSYADRMAELKGTK